MGGEVAVSLQSEYTSELFFTCVLQLFPEPKMCSSFFSHKYETQGLLSLAVVVVGALRFDDRGR